MVTVIMMTNAVRKVDDGNEDNNINDGGGYGNDDTTSNKNTLK